jgi:hypothetical protein
VEEVLVTEQQRVQQMMDARTEGPLLTAVQNVLLQQKQTAARSRYFAVYYIMIT